MVVGLALAAIQMGMALPTGFLFGVGYGTGVRIGYEQVYPLLFPKGARNTTSELAATMKGMNTVYDAIGGKDASRMGIAVGITNAGEILNNPDFQVLNQLESSSSGLTSSNSNQTSRSGRGALDLSGSSSDEIVAEELAEFNTLTNSEIWTKVRAMSTGQILNSRTGSGMSKEWMDITGKVLLERTQSNFSGPTTTVQPTPPDEAALARGKQLSDDTEWRTWSSALALQKGIFHREKNIYLANKDKSFAKARQSLAKAKAALSKMRKMSNDYRHPNNNIRENALRLRRELTTSGFKI